MSEKPWQGGPPITMSTGRSPIPAELANRFPGQVGDGAGNDRAVREVVEVGGGVDRIDLHRRDHIESGLLEAEAQAPDAREEVDGKRAACRSATGRVIGGLAQASPRYSADRAWAVSPSPRARTEAVFDSVAAPAAEAMMRLERFWKS